MVEAEAPELLGAVISACRGWEGDPEEVERSLRLDVTFRNGPGSTGNVVTQVQVHGPHLRIAGAMVEAWADADSGEAWCALSEEALRDGAALRDDIFDPLLLFLLTRSGRTPVHASAFLADDLAILLLGPSGAGKSCLALAAQEAGYPLLSDDTVYVQTHPDLRIWGIPRPIHVLPHDAPTGSGSTVRVRNGKLKYAVPIREGAGAVTARKAVLCLLSRGTEASLGAISPGDVMRSHGTLEAGFDLLQDEIEAAVELLVRGGAWRLTLSDDPADAIRLLSGRLPSLAKAASP